jgi:hypothetical protein
VEIKLKELEVMFAYLFKRAHACNIDHINLDHDFYWNIGSDERLDLTKDSSIMVGSLRDDFQSLQLLLERKHAASVIDLERFGNLLIYMSESILKSEQIFY